MSAAANAYPDLPAHVSPAIVHDLDIYQPGPPGADLFQFFRSLKQGDRPVFWTRCNGGHWIIARGDLIVRVLKEYETFSSARFIVPRERNPDQPSLPINLDPPDHGVYRVLLSHAFSIKTIAELKPKVRALTIELIEAFRAEGRCDFVRDFALRMPIGVFMRLVDLPESDRLTLLDAVQKFIHPGKEAATIRTDAITAYLRPVIAERRANPRDDLISRLGKSEVYGRQLTEDEHLRMCTLLLIGGLDSVAATLGFFARHLADNPEDRRRLREAPETNPRAVEELLRRYPTVVAAGRLVVKEVEIGGVRMLPGDQVICPTNQANFDDALFPDPMRVDFDRRPDILSFGAGAHKCVGAALARAELAIFLEEWLARIPEFEVEPGAEIVFKPGINLSYAALPLRWPT